MRRTRCTVVSKSLCCALLMTTTVMVAAAAAPIADADTPFPQAGSESAADTVRDLQSSGFDVEINWLEGHPNVPLNECKVTEIHNPNGAMASMTTLSTVYIDVACPNAK